MQRPIRMLLSRYPRKVFICFGACMLNAVGFYMVLTYIPNYLEVTLSFDPAMASTITTIVLVAYIGLIFV